ncbi:MAG: DNA polymerase III subunit alpha, partial [Prevotellaceae bacterium]|nr:DNA polymerase III subunit alpha [Candidatus Faecinaster equi]
DELTYKLYSEGKTIGTFQFESPGMQKYLRELQPSTFEDLIAMNALYRPGPMDYIPDFIDRKLGKKPIEYDIPVMEKYLKDSYGITVYQEQVMLLSRLLANFTRGESDTLRKAMGKKLKDKLDHLKPKFIAGGKSNGHDEKVLEKIWTDWEKFASYAFNKSHATCYSWVAFQTGYMKAHYPAQYMAAVMSNNVTDIKEITKLMTECKKMGINTLGPDVNESYVRFSANKDGDVRYGLEAVRGIGTNAAEIIVKERKEKGPFTSIYDFAERIPQSICNKKVYESLVNSGAFDCFDTLKREQYMLLNNDAIPFLEALMNYGAHVQEEKMMAQTSLFGDDEAAAIKKPTVPANNIEWNQIEKLKMERDYIGIYLSAHPLDDYAVVLRKCCNVQCGDLNDIEGLYKQKVTTLRFGGIVTGVSEKISKQGKPFGIVKLEDYSDEKELMIFDRDWITFKNYFTIDAALYIVAKLETSRFNPDGRVFTHYESIQFLSDAKKDLVNNIELTGSLDNYDDKFCAWLNDYCNNNPGNTTLKLTIIDKQLHGKIFTKASKKINVLPEFLDEVEADDLFQVNIS